MLLTGAADLVKAMGWEDDALLRQAKDQGIERSLFPDLSAEEQRLTDLLRQTNDLQINVLTAKANLPISKVAALLFQLEMTGVVKPMAGGAYHLLN